MMKQYASFSEWKKDQSTKNQKLIGSLQSLLKKVAPNLTQTVKWSQGCWLNENQPVIFIHCEPDYVQLGFHRGVNLKDPEKLLEGKAKYVRHIKIYTNKNVNKTAFTKLILQVSK